MSGSPTRRRGPGGAAVTGGTRHPALPAHTGGAPGRAGWRAVFFGLAALAIVAGVAWALLGSRLLVIRSIRITGTGPGLSQAQVIAAAQLQRGLPLIRVSPSVVARRIERLKLVQSAMVSRDWPDTVVISVRLRTPVFAIVASHGYTLIDAFGVGLRQAGRPGRFPLLTVAGTGPLRGSPAVRAAAEVLRELPPGVVRQVRAVRAATPADVSVRLADGVQIVWGDTGRASQKAKELVLLMHTHARVYDVSAPGTAVTQG